MVKTKTEDKSKVNTKEGKGIEGIKGDKMDKVYRVIGIVFNVILIMFILLETLNLFLNYRFLPVLILLVISIAYLGLKLVKYLWSKFKVKIKERRLKVEEPKNKAKEIISKGKKIEEDSQEEQESKGWVVFDNIVKVIKMTGKVFIGLFIFWMLFDSVSVNGKLQAIEESNQIYGNVLECTNIVFDGVCVVENKQGLHSVIFTSEGGVLNVVEGNVLQVDLEND